MQRMNDTHFVIPCKNYLTKDFKMKKQIKLILCFAISVIVIIGGFFIVKGLLKQNSVDSENSDLIEIISESDEDDEIYPTLNVANDLICDINSRVHFSYTVNNASDYKVYVEIVDSDIADIDKNSLLITPKLLGNTKIKTRLIVDEDEIIKYTNLKITTDKVDCNIKILENSKEPEFLVKNNEYIIEVSKSHGHKENNDVIISFTDIFNGKEVCDYSLIKLSSNNKITTYKFIPKTTGKYKISYADKYANDETEVFCYDKTNFINANIKNANKIGDNYCVYLYKTNYENDAINDGYYNSAEIEYNQNIDSYEKLDIEITSIDETSLKNKISYATSGNIIKIKAMDICKFVVKIFSSTTKQFINIRFCVEKILASHIVFNGIKYLVSELNSITQNININEPENFGYSIFPTYALGKIDISSDDGVIISDGTVVVNSFNNYNVAFKYNDIIVLKIQYVVNRNFYFVIDPSVNIQPSNSCEIIENSNECLEINYDRSTFGDYFKLTFRISNDNNEYYSYKTSAELLNDSFEKDDNVSYFYQLTSNSLFIIFDKKENVEFYLRLVNDSSVFIKIKINII